MSRRTLLRKMKLYGIGKQEFKGWSLPRVRRTLELQISQISVANMMAARFRLRVRSRIA